MTGRLASTPALLQLTFKAPSTVLCVQKPRRWRWVRRAARCGAAPWRSRRWRCPPDSPCTRRFSRMESPRPCLFTSAGMRTKSTKPLRLLKERKKGTSITHLWHVMWCHLVVTHLKLSFKADDVDYVNFNICWYLFLLSIFLKKKMHSYVSMVWIFLCKKGITCMCLSVCLFSPALEDLTAPMSAALPVLLRAGRWHPPGDGAGATLGTAAGHALPWRDLCWDLRPLTSVSLPAREGEHRG